MFESLVLCKCLIIILIIALIIVLFLYSQKKSCRTEGMKNIDTIPLSSQKKVLKKHSKNNKFKHKKNGQKKRKIPLPLDDRPDLSQCQPCICPGKNQTDLMTESHQQVIGSQNKYRYINDDDEFNFDDEIDSQTDSQIDSDDSDNDYLKIRKN